MRFDGATFDRQRDEERLSAQYARVFRLMEDGAWRSLSEIGRYTDAPSPSVSARLRDMRKKRFGGHTVERRYMGVGLFEYRLIKQEAAA
jgi:hypothetical protein